MASAHEPREVTWVEIPGGRLAAASIMTMTGARATADLIAEALS